MTKWIGLGAQIADVKWFWLQSATLLNGGEWDGVNHVIYGLILIITLPNFVAPVNRICVWNRQKFGF